MNNWISIEDRLPNHNQIVLVFSIFKKGYGVSVFVDSIKMNETLHETGYGYEAVNTKEHPYYFVSQEVKQHIYKEVTHWMPLPYPPYGATS